MFKFSRITNKLSNFHSFRASTRFSGLHSCPVMPMGSFRNFLKDRAKLRYMKTVTTEIEGHFYKIANFIAENDPQNIRRREILQEIYELDEIAQYHCNSAMYSKAVEALMSMTYLARLVCREDDSLVGEYKKRIADIFFEVKEWENAINYYEKSLEIFEKTFGEEHERVARCHFLLGKCYCKQSDYEEGIEHLNRALAIYQELNCERDFSEEIALCHSNLATNYISLKRYKGAAGYFEMFFKQIKKSSKEAKISKENSVFNDQFYMDYGTALAKGEQNFETALKYLNLYLESQIQYDIGETLGTALCYLKIGEVKALQGQYVEAIKFCQKSVEVTKEVGGRNHPQIGIIYNVMSEIYLKIKNEEKAELYFKKAMKYDNKVNKLVSLFGNEVIKTRKYS